ncbi:hypothetical protein MPH_05998 [Macrophomina phaseolina MS6]|uniref:Cytochrome P450 n=1 Tax=Macrophomina phaseolina (strain MS6) TaxID=1126212 RepID=K2SIX2_MACPH|nr:hypothetical protein MPH_05998 [Macrophomina phaseolina MS6]
MIASPEGFKIIYKLPPRKAGKGFVKGKLYGVVKGKRTFDMTAERDENVHSQQRRLVSCAYAMDTMKSLEPYVDATIEVLLEKIEEAGSKGQVANFSYLLQFLAFDVIGEVSFARRFGYLDALSDGGVFRTISAVMASAVRYEVGTTAWALHRNRGVFGDDAEDFRPERWLDEQRKHEMYPNQYFFSIGGGSRTCIGKNIAMLEMGKVLPTILLHFDLQLAPEKGSPKEVYGLFVALEPLSVIALGPQIGSNIGWTLR